jgi:1-acyl-sn-glycerol-3-phosphate acyltransferase
VEAASAHCEGDEGSRILDAMVDQSVLATAQYAAPSHVQGSPIAYRVAHLVGVALLRLLFNFEIVGRANLPVRGSYIVVSNHLNWLDAFALLVALPRDPRVHLLGWSAVMRSSKLAWLIRTSKGGFIPVEREPGRRGPERHYLRRRLTECLRDGYVVAMFPEGQVGCIEGSVSRFMPGFAQLAVLTGAPIVPIGLSGTRDLWWRKRVRVTIGSPIRPDEPRIDLLAERTRAAVSDLIPEYREPSGIKLFRRKLTRLIPSLTNWTTTDQ